MRQHALVAAIAAALFPACVLGAIEKLSVLNDGRMMFTIDTFGFDDGGKISLEMKDLAVMVDGKSVSPEGDIGILVSNVDTEIILKMEETIDLCLIDQPGLDILESWQIDLPLTKPKVRPSNAAPVARRPPDLSRAVRRGVPAAAAAAADSLGARLRTRHSSDPALRAATLAA